MLTPKPDPLFVRASVADKCNLNCRYCPKNEGMENRVPAHLAGDALSTDDYCQNLQHIARNGVRGISFTGGEPTLNPDLPVIVRRAVDIFERVELTSNGYRLLEMLPLLAPHLDVLKVSLDSLDPTLNSHITRGRMSDASKAVACVEEACRLGLTVGVNVVVMRSTLSEVDGILSHCRQLNRRGHPGRAYVSLLDFYYSPEQREYWEAEFTPIDGLSELFEARYGTRHTQQRFGCNFYWFDADGVEVRFKDSLGATQRASKCLGCKHYCQEGIYGIKHSVEGWITSCPSNEPSLGAHLSRGLSSDEADQCLAPLMAAIRDSRPDAGSFDTLLETHSLRPNMRFDLESLKTPFIRLQQR